MGFTLSHIHNRRILLFFCLLLSSTLFSQSKRNNVWYFGSFAGIDFNPIDGPVALTNSQMVAIEGCSSIADDNGNLLCYSNGKTIWNSNHEVMINGDNLSTSTINTTQATIIVPKPGSSIIYYIFTLDRTPGTTTNALSYSEIDFSEPLGEVTEKNVFIDTVESEKLAVVRHANGEDIWLMTLNVNTDEFIAFLITKEGIVPTPRISNIGVTIGLHELDVKGQLKISPSGERLAVANWYSANFLVCDFDNATGEVSNPIRIYTPEQRLSSTMGGPSEQLVYGVEFSPNDSLLYVSQQIEIFQYSLTAANISGSAVSLPTNMYTTASSLQLGPDHKIYCTAGSQTTFFLTVINEPNKIGTACDLQENGISLNGGIAEAGLPNILLEPQKPAVIYVPNTFSPNNDGINDVFIPKTNQAISTYELSIFSRWGELLFVTDDINKVWDGKTNNKPAPMGLYSVQITYEDVFTKQTHNISQPLYLIR